MKISGRVCKLRVAISKKKKKTNKLKIKTKQKPVVISGELKAVLVTT